MSIHIVPASEVHYRSLHEALDVVAREKRFLAATQAPPLEQSLAFYRGLASAALPHVVAVQDRQVIGWADVSALSGQLREHIGVLGIALLPAYRHAGLGTELMRTVIQASWQRRLTRLELTVREDNANAIALYESFGFAHEGVRRCAHCVDGAYYDGRAMALLRCDVQTSTEPADHRSCQIGV